MGQRMPFVAMIALAVVIGTTLVLRGPMGKALAEWIRGWSKTDEQWMAMKAATPTGSRRRAELWI